LAPGVRVLRVDEACALVDAIPDDAGWCATVRDAHGRQWPVRTRLWGRHNLDNVRCALVAAAAVGVPLEACLDGLAGFRGVARRLTDRGEVPLAAGGCARLIDDFAHHPDALSAAALALADHLPGRRRVALFQPHQVSRTENFLQAFAEALAGFDAVGLCDIFVARDRRPERAGAVLDALVGLAGAHVSRLGPAATAEPAARALLRPDDACVVMGAGDIDGLAARLAGAPARP
jgi:UDP-N-acetylmuramate--alanine ligase